MCSGVGCGCSVVWAGFVMSVGLQCDVAALGCACVLWVQCACLVWDARALGCKSFRDMRMFLSLVVWWCSVAPQPSLGCEYASVNFVL